MGDSWKIHNYTISHFNQCAAVVYGDSFIVDNFQKSLTSQFDKLDGIHHFQFKEWQIF